MANGQFHKKNIVTGPGYTGRTQPPPPEEIAQAREEAARKPEPPGQEAANQFFRDVANKGLEDSPVPEQIFHGKSVDPEDYADGPVRKFVGRSGMRERLGTDMAIGKIDPKLAAKLGINLETEHPTYMLMNNYAGNGRNFEQEWEQNNPDGRIPVYQEGPHKGEPYNMQGLVLGVIPKEVYAEIMADNQREVDERQYALEHGNPDLPEGRELEKMRNEMSEAVRQMLKGSPTEGKDLEEAMRMYSPDDTARTIESYRWQFAPRPDGEAEVQAAATQARNRANAIDQAVETAKAQATGRKSFAVQGLKGS